jgi:hypothetical protein
MKITTLDLERWKENSISILYKVNPEVNNLDYLKETKLEIIREDSNGMFYGWANFLDNKIRVYESNPSRYFPSAIREVWNQSGMDHELIGHIFGNYQYGEGLEDYTRKIQIEIAKFRGKDNNLWNLASFILPFLFKLKN